MSRLLIASLVFAAAASTGAADAIAWQPWSDAAFATAKREHKFVIMDLEAVWCHWCHVMDETTYRDPMVIALVGARYVAVRVDQDSRPDLANRYEDYGWPATVVFAADGSEIARRRGYLTPAEMASMLQAIIDDPSPGPSVAPAARPQYPPDARPDDAVAEQVRKRLLSGYDRAGGGWSGEHKFLDADNVEFCLRAAARGDSEAGFGTTKPPPPDRFSATPLQWARHSSLCTRPRATPRGSRGQKGPPTSSGGTSPGAPSRDSRRPTRHPPRFRRRSLSLTSRYALPGLAISSDTRPPGRRTGHWRSLRCGGRFPRKWWAGAAHTSEGSCLRAMRSAPNRCT